MLGVVQGSTDEELRVYLPLIDVAIMGRPKRVNAEAGRLGETEHERRSLMAIATLVRMADAEGVSFDRYVVALGLARRDRPESGFEVHRKCTAVPVPFGKPVGAKGFEPLTSAV